MARRRSNHRHHGVPVRAQKRRVQTVDIKGQIDRHIADDLFHLSENIIPPVVDWRASSVAIYFIKTQCEYCVAPNDADRQALLSARYTYRAVIEFAAVSVGIGMRVKIIPAPFCQNVSREALAAAAA